MKVEPVRSVSVCWPTAPCWPFLTVDVHPAAMGATIIRHRKRKVALTWESMHWAPDHDGYNTRVLHIGIVEHISAPVWPGQRSDGQRPIGMYRGD